MYCRYVLQICTAICMAVRGLSAGRRVFDGISRHLIPVLAMHLSPIAHRYAISLLLMTHILQKTKVSVPPICGTAQVMRCMTPFDPQDCIIGQYTAGVDLICVCGVNHMTHHMYCLLTDQIC